MGCPTCEAQAQIEQRENIDHLKDKFSKLAKLAGYEAYAIVKCDCKDGYAWRPLEHPDAKKYAIELCIVN